MRFLRSLYTIPAHLSNVSDIRFFHANNLYHKLPETEGDGNYTKEEWGYRSGLFFASSGYDGLVKIWSADDWQLLRTLTTDAGKVMSVDVSSDGNHIASGTYNRNFQLFAPEEVV